MELLLDRLNNSLVGNTLSLKSDKFKMLFGVNEIKEHMPIRTEDDWIDVYIFVGETIIKPQRFSMLLTELDCINLIEQNKTTVCFGPKQTNYNLGGIETTIKVFKWD